MDLSKRDPLYLIIEAGYHCGHTNEELFQMMDSQGIERPSDETLDYLRGEYAEHAATETLQTKE